MIGLVDGGVIVKGERDEMSLVVAVPVSMDREHCAEMVALYPPLPAGVARRPRFAMPAG
jgi:hypothetical protein